MIRHAHHYLEQRRKIMPEYLQLHFTNPEFHIPVTKPVSPSIDVTSSPSFSEYQTTQTNELPFLQDVQTERFSPIQGRTLALEFAYLCSQIDNDQTTSIRWDDQRLDAMKDLLGQSAASPVFKDMLTSEMFRHILSGKKTAYESFADRLGVDNDAGNLGVFSLEGAKLAELREMHVFAPAEIEGAIRRGEIGNAERARRQQKLHISSFESHYGEAYNSPQNRALVLPREPYTDYRNRR